MITAKGFWYFLMGGSLFLFACALILGYYLFPYNHLLALTFFLALLVIHMAEIPVSLKIGRDKRIPEWKTALKTLLFGFTWWVPLKKGIIDQ